MDYLFQLRTCYHIRPELAASNVPIIVVELLLLLFP